MNIVSLREESTRVGCINTLKSKVFFLFFFFNFFSL